MLLIYLIGCFVIAKAGHDEKPVLQEIFVSRKLVENQNVKLNCDLLQGAKRSSLAGFLMMSRFGKMKDCRLKFE